jgi:hypothetical protein
VGRAADALTFSGLAICMTRSISDISFTCGCAGIAATGKADDLTAAARSAAERAAGQPASMEQTGREADRHGSPSAADADAASPLDPAIIAKQQLANILAAGERAACTDGTVHLAVRTARRNLCSKACPCCNHHAARPAGSEQLGEVASLCMERMVALARSVGAFARFRQESDDGIKWPAAPLDIARMLCTEVRLRIP